MRSRSWGSWQALLSLFAFGLAACAAPTAGPADAPIPSGSGQQTVRLDGTRLEVFTYRPDGCALSGFLLVFHGTNRNAAKYRDDAMPLGQKLCMLVVAPLFDKARYPNWTYHLGGIVRGSVQAEERWTVSLVPRLAAWVRAREGRPDLPYAMIGHSAGGQFLSRVAAYVPNDAMRMVVANPSSWVWPSLDIAAPYGMGRVYDGAEREEALRRYLAAPVIVMLGQKDTGSYELADDRDAEKQGGTRLERGQNVFRAAELVARQHGWPLNWRLVLVPGVGHSDGKMFGSEQAVEALRP
jgi:poly(3-hydroxybutyrate) depolymerase